MIVQYIYKGKKKDPKRRRIGVMVADKIPVYSDSNDPQFVVGIGASIVNESMGDKFKRDSGLHIAIGRMEKSLARPFAYPISMKKQMREFVERCQKYYQDATVIAPDINYPKVCE